MAKTRGSTTQAAKPRSDAYVGLLFIALLAQIAGAVFFFLDYNQYPSNKPPAVDLTPAPSGGPRPGGQAGGAVGAAGAAGAAGAQAAGGAAGAQAVGGQPAMMGGMAGMAGAVK